MKKGFTELVPILDHSGSTSLPIYAAGFAVLLFTADGTLHNFIFAAAGTAGPAP